MQRAAGVLRAEMSGGGVGGRVAGYTTLPVATYGSYTKLFQYSTLRNLQLSRFNRAGHPSAVPLLVKLSTSYILSETCNVYQSNNKVRFMRPIIAVGTYKQIDAYILNSN